MGSLINAIEQGKYYDVGWEKYRAYHEFLKFGNKVDEEVHKMPELWFKNAEVNIPWLDENKDKILGSVYDLPDYKDKAIIYVGASPILKKTWKHLKDIDDNFIIVAVNSSVRYLLNRGIKPHYCVCIDGAPSKYWDLDLGKKGKDVIGLFSVYVDPTALRQFPGKFYIIPYTHKGQKYSKTTAKVRRRWGKGISSGGNALNAAVSAFINCTESKIMLLAGNELSFKGNYYVHGRSSNDDLPHYFTKNVKGERVRVIVPLWSYKIWLETNLELLSPPYVFYNCSEGTVGVGPDGKLLDFIKQRDLKDGIKEVKDAFNFEKQQWHDKSERIYNMIYEQDYAGIKRYTNETSSRSIWKFVINELPAFKKGLDVGCGKGLGIQQMREKGLPVYGVDIAPSLKQIWKDRGMEDICHVASAHKMPFKDNEFDLVICTETLEHIPMDGVDDTLKEILRVGSDKFLFTISKMSTDRNGVILHLLVKPPEWWEAKLEQHGFEIAYSLDRLLPGKTEKIASCFIYAVKNKEPYLNGKKLTLSDTDYPLYVPFGKGTITEEELCQPTLSAA